MALIRPLVTLTAGTYTPIPALQFARRVELQEDDSVPAQGLLLRFPEDGFVNVFAYAPQNQPVIRGNDVSQGRGTAPLLGWPVQGGLNARAADNYVMASCMGGTTKLRVREID